MHFTPVEFGWLGLFIAAALIIANIIASKLIAKLGLQKPNIIVVALLIIGSISMLIFGFVGLLNFWVIMIPFFFYIIGLGIVSVTCSTNAFSLFGDIAGSCGSLWTGLQFFILFFSSIVYAHLHGKTQMPFASILIVLSVLTTLFLISTLSRRKNADKNSQLY